MRKLRGSALVAFLVVLAVAPVTRAYTPTIWDMQDAQVREVLQILLDLSALESLDVDPSVDLDRVVTVVSGTTDWSRVEEDVCRPLGLACEFDEAGSTLRVWRSSGPGALVRLVHEGLLSWRPGTTGAWHSLHAPTVIPPGSELYLPRGVRVGLLHRDRPWVLEGPVRVRVEQELFLQPALTLRAARSLRAGHVRLSGPPATPSLRWSPPDGSLDSGLAGVTLAESLGAKDDEHPPSWGGLTLRGAVLRAELVVHGSDQQDRVRKSLRSTATEFRFLQEAGFDQPPDSEPDADEVRRLLAAKGGLEVVELVLEQP